MALTNIRIHYLILSAGKLEGALDGGATQLLSGIAVSKPCCHGRSRSTPCKRKIHRHNDSAELLDAIFGMKTEM